jgi:hypothetical protein
MQLTIPNVAFFAMTFFSVSLWEVVMFQRNHTNYPYRQGFAIFSIIQWIAIAVGMVAILGFLYGIVVLVICMTVLQYVTHFSLGLLWNFISKKHYLFPTAIFAINVWALLVLGIAQLFLTEP